MFPKGLVTNYGEGGGGGYKTGGGGGPHEVLPLRKGGGAESFTLSFPVINDQSLILRIAIKNK